MAASPAAPNGPTQTVRKLFVIGLGTTGTEICNLLAERLENEFGSLDHVPWVDFLCFETDSSKSGIMRDRNKLHPLTIPRNAYQGLLNNTSALDQQIDFSTYWDIGTLRNISDISKGVGNIRMAGRLAFFYPSNNKMIENILPRAVNDLSRVTEVQAKQARGPLPDGSDPAVRFLTNDDANAAAADGTSGAGGVTIAIVGTLCGGTGSGICVDLGYYLTQRCPEANTLAFFTLPRPDLDPMTVDAAQRFKVNAYSALKELHHFSQIGEVTYTAKYPLKPEWKINQKYPYEATLLSWPREATKNGEEELNAAIAERLFLLSFSGTDPFAEAVDVANQYGPEDQQMHTMFGTLGLSTMEYPGPRLVDYCAHRLLAHTFTRWAASSLKEPQINAELSALRLTWEQIRADVLLNSGGIDGKLKTKEEAALSALAKSSESWIHELNQIRLAFGDQTGVSEDPSLPNSSVIKNLYAGQANTAAVLEERVLNWVKTHLMSWNQGPSACLQIVDAAMHTLGEIRNHLSQAAPSDEELRRAGRDLDDLNGDFLVRALGLNKRASTDMIVATRPKLYAYVNQRLDSAVSKVLVSGKDSQGLTSNGVIDDTLERLENLRRRLANLQQACSVYGQYCIHRQNALADPPRVNGPVLMGQQQADSDYRHVLARNGDATALEQAQDTAAVRLLGNWKGVASALITKEASPWDAAVPAGEPSTVGQSALPTGDTRALLDDARRLFNSLLNKDVISVWAGWENHDALAAQLASDAAYFLSVSDEAALNLLGQIPQNMQIAVYPRARSSAPDVAAFQANVSDFDPKPADSRNRASLLQECYQLPLEAVPGIVSATDRMSLESARFEKWLTVARKDIVAWQPLSPEERERLRRYRQMLAVAIVLKAVEVEEGRLRIREYREADSFLGTGYRDLPNAFEDAARQWALSGHDLEQRELNELEGHLNALFSDIRRPNSQGNEGFVRLLNDRLPYSGAGMAQWDKEEAGRLLMSYCMNDTELASFVHILKAPKKEVLNALRFAPGDTLMTDEPCPAPAFYCIKPNCDGKLGDDIRDAATRGWRCPKCTQTYDRIDHPSLPAWMSEANRRKSGLAASVNGPVNTGISTDAVHVPAVDPYQPQ